MFLGRSNIITRILFQIAMGDSKAAVFVRYICVGGVVYASDFLSFLAFYLLFEAQPLFANALGKIMGAGVGFLLHKFVTYRWEKGNSVLTEAARYMLLLAFNLIISYLIYYSLIYLFGSPYILFRIVSDVIVIIISWLGMLMWVFPQQRKRRG